MGSVEIGDRANLLWRECIHQAAPWSPDVGRPAKPKARGARREINGLGVGVVQVELDAIAELFS
jgi:hypothetical protein